MHKYKILYSFFIAFIIALPCFSLGGMLDDLKLEKFYLSDDEAKSLKLKNPVLWKEIKLDILERAITTTSPAGKSAFSASNEKLSSAKWCCLEFASSVRHNQDCDCCCLLCCCLPCELVWKAVFSGFKIGKLASRPKIVQRDNGSMKTMTEVKEDRIIPIEWRYHSLLSTILALSNGVNLYRQTHGIFDESVHGGVNEIEAYHLVTANWLATHELQLVLTSPEDNNCLFDCFNKSGVEMDVESMKKRLLNIISLIEVQRLGISDNKMPLTEFPAIEMGEEDAILFADDDRLDDSNILKLVKNTMKLTSATFLTLAQQLTANLTHQDSQVARLLAYQVERPVLVIEKISTDGDLMGTLYKESGEEVINQHLIDEIESKWIIVVENAYGHYLLAKPKSPEVSF